MQSFSKGKQRASAGDVFVEDVPVPDSTPSRGRKGASHGPTSTALNTEYQSLLRHMFDLAQEYQRAQSRDTVERLNFRNKGLNSRTNSWIAEVEELADGNAEPDGDIYSWEGMLSMAKQSGRQLRSASEAAHKRVGMKFFRRGQVSGPSRSSSSSLRTHTIQEQRIEPLTLDENAPTTLEQYLGSDHAKIVEHGMENVGLADAIASTSTTIGGTTSGDATPIANKSRASMSDEIDLDFVAQESLQQRLTRLDMRQPVEVDVEELLGPLETFQAGRQRRSAARDHLLAELEQLGLNDDAD